MVFRNPCLINRNYVNRQYRDINNNYIMFIMTPMKIREGKRERQTDRERELGKLLSLLSTPKVITCQ